MTPEEINRRIAEWAGCEPKFMSVNGVTYDQHCEPFPKDYYGSNAAMDLLAVLAKKGYRPYLRHVEKQWIFWIRDYEGHQLGESGNDTIPAAICTAIIELIEREGRL